MHWFPVLRIAFAIISNDIRMLGLLVLIRTFLSFSLEVELNGRWPWQSRPPDA